jgi:hypothetical protein
MMGLLLVLACGPSTDPERLSQALDPSVSLSRALRGCERIKGEDAQGDCLSAAVELREGTELEDCQSITSDRWRNECIFVLAERLGRSDVAAGISLCEETLYVRECLFHLIRDKAKGATGLAPIEAEAALVPFWSVRRVPDASIMFWKEWVRHTVRSLDQPVPSDLCVGLQDSDGCEAGLKKGRNQMLRGVPKAQRCARIEAGQAILQLKDESQAVELNPMELVEIQRSCAASKR